jgi:predicted amino acid-binding ACT domain protein
MPVKARRVEYFYVTAEDRPGQAHGLLSRLAQNEVNLLALSLVPVGPNVTQFTLFPESTERLARAAERLGLVLAGPHRAILITGDDRLGALVDFHGELSRAGINVYAANGVTDCKGGYGYVMYVRPEDFDNAARTLDAE